MSILKSIPTKKFIDGTMISITENTLIGDHETEYKTCGEIFIVVKTHNECVVTLDHTTTDNVTIKSLTKTLVKPDVNEIDGKYEEVLLEEGVCVTFFYCLGMWYIGPSDGLKN